MQDRVGQQFGNYRLKRLIGKGGYAEVYLAEHIMLPDLRYAIKILIGTHLSDEGKDEFLFEARAITNLQRLSSHIVQIRDFGIQESQIDNWEVPYIVMEYAPEGTLRQHYPHDTKMPLEKIALYVNQVAEALQCAHDQSPPIVHRDVKPENMLLRTIDHVLLSDFGIAMTARTGMITRPVKKEAGILGTAAYIAPERLSGQMRRASDQYSLAIVVYEWLSGSLPFDGDDREVCFKQLKMPPPALTPMYPHVTVEIEQVVMRALAKDPDERYPRVKDFAAALGNAIETAQRLQPSAFQPTLIPSALPATLSTVQATPVENQSTQGWSSFATYSPIPGATGPVLRTPTRLASPSGPQSARSFPSEIQDFFAFSSQFARDSRYSFFRNGGVFLNGCSAVIAGLLLHNILIFLACLLFSFLLFSLCVCAVEEKLALFFGVLVALYWGGIGWISGIFIVSLLPHYNLLLPACASLIFFGLSLVLHMRYVARKNL